MRMWRSKAAIKIVMKACEFFSKSKNGFLFSNIRTYKCILTLLGSMRCEEESKNFIRFILSNAHRLP